MKKWKEYEDRLLTGEWHIHTTRTDGKAMISEYVELAEKLELPLLAFTEHVRKELTYDFQEYLEAISAAQFQTKIPLLRGIEARILPSGEFDFDYELLELVDYVVVAFHKFPANIETYERALLTVLEDPHVDTWGHPGHFLRRKGLQLADEIVDQALAIMKERDILFELNRFYDTPSVSWVPKIKRFNIQVVNGGNVHSLADMRDNYERTQDDLKNHQFPFD